MFITGEQLLSKYFISHTHKVISNNPLRCIDCEYAPLMDRISVQSAITNANRVDPNTGLYEYALVECNITRP